MHREFFEEEGIGIEHRIAAFALISLLDVLVFAVRDNLVAGTPPAAITFCFRCILGVRNIKQAKDTSRK